MKQHYVDFNFKPRALALIDHMNTVVEELGAQGYTLTMRQLYYQLVARGIIENTLQSYKSLTGLGNDARLAGLIDWDAIEDRTREVVKRANWGSAGEIVQACADQFHMDMWKGQPVRPLVIVEKEALAGIIDRACHRRDVPYLAARGYPSVTVLREVTQSLFEQADREGQSVLVLHLGDHDPSGIDMSRDLRNRFDIFMRDDVPDLSMEFKRIALNMTQIEEQHPPPNPAKTTDSRFESYLAEFGDESWELDALDPKYIDNLIEREIEAVVDPDAWDARKEEIEHQRSRLRDAATWLDEQE